MLMSNPVTFEELIEKLRRVDEVSLLEMLDIDTDDLIEKFRDVIEDKYNKLLKEVE